MNTVKIITENGSQMVQLPGNYHFTDDEIMITRVKNITMLIPKDNQWKSLLESLELFTEDFVQSL